MANDEGDELRFVILVGGYPPRANPCLGTGGVQLNNHIIDDIQKRKASNKHTRRSRTQEDPRLRITWSKASKGIRWMPWRQVPKKDVVHCEKLRRAVCRRTSRRCPNGETRRGSCRVTPQGEGTGGTETSHVPRGKERIPRVVASESGGAQTATHVLGCCRPHGMVVVSEGERSGKAGQSG